jgi:hypothetical protein
MSHEHVRYLVWQPYTRVYVVSIHTIATHGTLVLQMQVPVHVMHTCIWFVSHTHVCMWLAYTQQPRVHA